MNEPQHSQAISNLVVDVLTSGATPEAREGLGAFLDKRAAQWTRSGC